MDGQDLLPNSDGVTLSQTQRLTMQFYDWEQRGRGWQVWPCPVELEPPFRPFYGHALPALPAVDDTRKPTLLSSAVEAIRSGAVLWARSLSMPWSWHLGTGWVRTGDMGNKIDRRHG